MVKLSDDRVGDRLHAPLEALGTDEGETIRGNTALVAERQTLTDRLVMQCAASVAGTLLHQFCLIILNGTHTVPLQHSQAIQSNRSASSWERVRASAIRASKRDHARHGNRPTPWGSERRRATALSHGAVQDVAQVEERRERSGAPGAWR
jgi:hypothetical protein